MIQCQHEQTNWRLKKCVDLRGGKIEYEDVESHFEKKYVRECWKSIQEQICTGILEIKHKNTITED